MSYFESVPKQSFPADDSDGRARQAALAEVDPGDDFFQAMVDFQSRGRLLVVGAASVIEEYLDELSSQSDCTFLVIEGQLTAPVTHAVYHATVVSCDGYLGAFRCIVARDGQEFDLGELVDKEKPLFDMVIDLAKPGLFGVDLPPLGYFAPDDHVAFASTLSQLEQYTGEFHKPKFFRYEADICAHGRSGLDGCTRCIDNCPTGAIVSIGEQVEVNPYLCQGGGSCTSSCPTGAMTYAWPTADVTGERVRAALASYFSAGGQAPVILFHDGETGVARVREVSQSLPSRVIPFALEETASVGAELWISALAWGACEVALLTSAAVAGSVRTELSQQVDLANEIVTGAGLAGDRISVIHADSAAALTSHHWAEGHDLERAAFSMDNGKRNAIRVAVDHIARASGSAPSHVALSKGSAFGRINVNQETCTLCMACVSVCPAAALQAGGDTPALRHIEWNCVQCGACEVACPEQAVTLEPRFVFDNDLRMSTVSLNEEAPFNCIKCGKAFATASVMKRMEEKLADHWMFQNPEQRDRLKMCEDCRIADMFDRDGGLTPHDRS